MLHPSQELVDAQIIAAFSHDYERIQACYFPGAPENIYIPSSMTKEI